MSRGRCSGDQRLEEMAEVGFVEILDEMPQALRICCVDRLRHGIDEARADLAALVVAKRLGRGGLAFGRIERAVLSDVHEPFPEMSLVAFLGGRLGQYNARAAALPCHG